jgi:hypothetical protein
LDDLNTTKYHCAAEIESHTEQDNAIENLECPEQRDIRAELNVPRLIRPTHTSNIHAEKLVVPVNAIEMRRKKGVNQKLN